MTNISDDKKLQELSKKLVNETPAEKQDSINKIKTLIRKTIDKYDGKKAKPMPRIGICVVCSGKVTEEYHFKYREPMIYGLGSGYHGHWQTSGLSCEDCGIIYAKLPK